MKPATLDHIVCLGASAGGLEALEAFFGALPPGTNAAFVVVVHLSPDFKSLMPELLAKRTSMPVASVSRDTTLQPEHVYVLPPGKNLKVNGISLRVEEQVRGPGHLNLPIDLFLTNLAQEAGEKAVAVILSGTGSDGSRGVRDIKELGGIILVQDPGSAKFDGMPRSAIQTGLVDHVGDPQDLAERVGRISGTPAPLELEDDPDGAGLDEVLVRLRTSLRSDHGFYRRPMMARRVRRRMAICGIATLQGYCELLDREIDELELLRQDLLIGVTGFFRDTTAFAALAEKALPDLIRSGEVHEPVRVWVPACSTGQEVYSLAIQLLEVMETIGIRRPIKIFATDVNERAVGRASRAHYSLAEVTDIQPPLIARYLEQRGSEYVIRSELRECVIFATHNLITDPPFTRMDLVSCRNLLIYLTPEAQHRVLASLHFALKPETGVLFLGAAELATPIESGVKTLDERARIYRRAGQTRLPLITGSSPDPRRQRYAKPKEKPLEIVRAATVATMEAIGRSSALVLENGVVAELLADPNQYFRLATGRPTTHISSLLEFDLATAVSASIARIAANPAAFIRSVRGTGTDEVQILVVPVPSDRGDRMFLIELMPGGQGPASAETFDDVATARIQQLEDEVRSTRETLQSTIEELQSTNEEMQSTNEELLAANEELQSTNEELHSVNEELFTVNAEFQRKNRELQTTTADLDNLLASTEIGSLFLDGDLIVRRFTPGLERVIQLVPHDIGRRITDFAHHLTGDFVPDILEVARTGQPIDRELRDTRGAWLSMRVRKYRSAVEGPSGVLVTFVEVTRLKNAEETARVVSASLRDANVVLEQQADQLEEMFSIIAHDLRRLVLGIDGMVELALAALEDGEGAAALERLRTGLQSVHQMRRMLDGLSRVALNRRKAVEVEEVDLRPWFDSLLQSFHEQCTEEGIQFHHACDGQRVRVARTAAEAALRNLVENAILYGSSADAPRIDVTCRVVDSRLHIVVSDNGQGIAPGDHPRVFELFGRLSDEIDGSGVGLVSARRLLQRAEGSLSLDSTPGQGARFEAILPLYQTSRHHGGVLLVEDNMLDTNAVRRSLPSLEITNAKTLREARELMQQHDYTLILLDLSLPDGHGLELLEAARRAKTRCPVIVLSGPPSGVDEELFGNEVYAVIPKSSIASGRLQEQVLEALDR